MRGPSSQEARAARVLGARCAWLVACGPDDVLGSLSHAPARMQVVAALGENPIACADVRALARDIYEADGLVLADARATGLYGCAYARMGADVTMAPVADDCCLVALRDAGVLDRLPELVAMVDGGTPDVAAYDLLDGQLQDQGATWRKASDVASVVASYLCCHPRVAEVRYPGLKSDPSFSVAAQMLQSGFGPIVDYRKLQDGQWTRVSCGPCDAKSLVLDLEQALA